MSAPSVVIAGAGPTGMTLGAELTLAGVEVLLVERRPSAELVGSRAGGLHARTIEVFDQRGIGERFVSAGKTAPVAGFGGTMLDLSDLASRRPYVLALWQNHIERILAEWVDELNVPIRRNCEVTGLAQDAEGVTVTLSDGASLRTKYLVGCDGGRSLVRKLAGIDFAGCDASVSNLNAEVEMAQTPPFGFKHDARGMHAIGKVDEGPRVRVVLTEDSVRATTEPTLRDVSELLVKVYGTDFGVHSPVWVSRFTDMARQAASYRAGRVLVAGDAAHVHYPTGGQGLNIGVQDAMNLGWKLAQVVKGVSPESLLDTYHAERHPIGARVLRLTMAQVAMQRPDERNKALADTVKDLLSMTEPRKRYAGIMSGLEVHYALDGGTPAAHPLVGRRMPDLEVETANGARSVYSFLHRAQPLLMMFGPRAPAGHSPTIQQIEAKYAGPWELPVIGAVSAPAAVLVRPDGYVAWVGEPADPLLGEAVRKWFGEASWPQSSAASA